MLSALTRQHRASARQRRLLWPLKRFCQSYLTANPGFVTGLHTQATPTRSRSGSLGATSTGGEPSEPRASMGTHRGQPRRPDGTSGQAVMQACPLLGISRKRLVFPFFIIYMNRITKLEVSNCFPNRLNFKFSWLHMQLFNMNSTVCLT